MKQLIRETLHQASHEVAALPFTTLVQRLRSHGAAVTEEVLVRVLSEPDSGARILNPWMGPQDILRRFLEGDRGADGPWVILEAGPDLDDPDPATPATLRIHQSLVRLGCHLDLRSSRDVARWVGLVEEATRLPRAA